MAKIYKNAAELVGNTPLLEVGNLEKELGLEARILVKLEYFNPAGSAKDRIALSMIEDAEERGVLKPGAVIIEPTSGNTGIGLASLAAIKGYRVILTMPETMSVERRNILKAYGAESVHTNPGFVRQLMLKLKKAGLMTSVAGHARPSLSKPADHRFRQSPAMFSATHMQGHRRQWLHRSHAWLQSQYPGRK